MTLQSPTAILIPLFSSSELTGCGYPGLMDRKNRSDMCGWKSNPRLPACRAPYPLGSPQFTLLLLCSHSPNDVMGWSSGAMVLGKLPVPGRPTIWMIVRQGPFALAVGAVGVVWTFLLFSIFPLLLLPLLGRRPDVD